MKIQYAACRIYLPTLVPFWWVRLEEDRIAAEFLQKAPCRYNLTIRLEISSMSSNCPIHFPDFAWDKHPKLPFSTWERKSLEVIRSLGSLKFEDWNFKGTHGPSDHSFHVEAQVVILAACLQGDDSLLWILRRSRSFAFNFMSGAAGGRPVKTCSRGGCLCVLSHLDI